MKWKEFLSVVDAGISKLVRKREVELLGIKRIELPDVTDFLNAECIYFKQVDIATIEVCVNTYEGMVVPVTSSHTFQIFGRDEVGGSI